MADVIQTNPAPEQGQGTNVVAIVAIVLLVGLAFLFFAYVLPMLQKPEAEPEQPGIEINLPADDNAPPSPSPEPSPAQ